MTSVDVSLVGHTLLIDNFPLTKHPGATPTEPDKLPVTQIFFKRIDVLEKNVQRRTTLFFVSNHFTSYFELSIFDYKDFISSGPRSATLWHRVLGSLVGQRHYRALRRPDVAYVTNLLARFLAITSHQCRPGGPKESPAILHRHFASELRTSGARQSWQDSGGGRGQRLGFGPTRFQICFLHG